LTKTLRAGIIGCGGIAFGKYLPALSKIKEAAVTAFCNTSLEKAEAARERFGAPGAEVFSDYRALLESGVDAVFVLTPNKSHARITVDALNAGKHVLCEKPMAASYEEALLMHETAEKTGKTLAIGYQNRFRPDSLYLKELCLRGDLGEIYMAKARCLRRRGAPTWGAFLDKGRQGGGALLDIGVHALDLTLWLMGDYDVKSVRGAAYNKLAADPGCANRFGPWERESFTVEDSAFAFITMKSGATIFLEASWLLNTTDERDPEASLFGTKAGAEMNNGKLSINGADAGKLYVKNIDLTSGGGAFYDGREIKTPGELETENFIYSILNGTDPVVSSKQALAVTRVLEAVYQSASEGREILL
jgi:predicted dehydrogenase